MTMGDDTIRASDQDRERLVEVLGEQTSQGRLTLAEFEERTARVYQARTWRELRVLVEDLPVRVTFAGEQPDPGAAPVPSTPRPAARHATWLVPLLLVLVVAAAVVGAVVLRMPPVAVIPLLIVARMARGGAYRVGRGYRRHGPRWR